MANASEELLYVFATTGTEKLIKDFKTVSTELQLQTKFVNDLAKTQGISKQAAEKLAQVYGVTGATLRKYNDDLKAADKEQAAFAAEQKKASQATKVLANDLGDLQKGLIAIGLAAGVFDFLKGVATDSIQASREFERLVNSLNFVAGSARQGAAELAFITQTSNQLGQSISKSVEAFTQFQASSKDLKLTRDIFEGLSQASAVLGLGTERTKLSFLALTQISSKGVVSLEELKRQLSESLPGALGIAARALNLTEQQLFKLVGSGTLLSKDFLPKFAAQLKKEFAGGVIDAVNSSEVAFGRFDNAVLSLQRSIGKNLEPITKGTLGALTDFANFFLKLDPIIQNSLLALAGLTVGFTGLVTAVVAFRALQIGEAFGAIISGAKAAGGVIKLLSSEIVFLTNAQIGLASAFAVGISAALILDTFNAIKSGANESNKAIDDLIESRKQLALEFGKPIPKPNLSPLEQSKSELNIVQQGVQKLQEDFNDLGKAVGVVGNAIGTVPGLPKSLDTSVKVTTTASERLNEKIVRFSDLLGESNKDVSSAESFQRKLAGGYNATQKEIDFQSKSLEASLKAVKAAVAPNELLTKSQEQQVKTIQGLIDALPKVAKAYDASGIKVSELTREYKDSAAELDISSAKEIAIIQTKVAKNILTETQGAKAIADLKTNAAKQQLEQNELEARNLSSLLKDKTFADTKAAQVRLTQLSGEQAKLRLEIATQEASGRKAIQDGLIKDLEKAEKLATEAVLASATARGKELLDLELQIGSNSLEAKSALRLKDLDNQRANIEDQIKLEQEKIAKLEALQPNLSGDAAEANEAKIRAAKQKTAELAGQLTQNEIDQNKAFAEQSAIPYQKQEEVIKRNLVLLDQQNKLREAGQAVITAQYDSAVAGAEREINVVNDGIKLRGELATADGEKRQIIIERLAKLGQSAYESEYEAVKRRQVLEDNLAKLKQAQLVQSQAADRAALEASLQRVETENKLTLAVARTNATRLEGKDAKANRAVDQANIEIKSQEAIAAKQRESLGITQQGVLVAAKKTEEERKYGQEIDLANAKTVVQQGATQAVGTAVAENTQKIVEQGQAIEGVAEKTKAITAVQANAIAARKGENAVIDEANKKLQDQADLQVKINDELRKGEFTLTQIVTVLENVTDLYAKQDNLKKSLTEQELQVLKDQRDALLAQDNPSGNNSQIKALDSQILDKEKELAQFKADAAKESLQATKDQLKAVTDTIAAERIKAIEFAKSQRELIDFLQVGQAAIPGAVESRDIFLEGINRFLRSAGYKPGQIPGFRSGVEGFEGGLARVHKGEIVQAPSGASAYINKPEVLMNLPSGSNVYTASQVRNSTSNPLLTEIKGLRSDLKNAKPVEQTFNLALKQDDALEHMRNLQYASMRGRIM